MCPFFGQSKFLLWNYYFLNLSLTLAQLESPLWPSSIFCIWWYLIKITMIKHFSVQSKSVIMIICIQQYITIHILNHNWTDIKQDTSCRKGLQGPFKGWIKNLRYSSLVSILLCDSSKFPLLNICSNYQFNGSRANLFFNLDFLPKFSN